MIEYSQELEQTSAELRSTAQQLQQANERLRALDTQKDDFLSQVSHEVRTPMTSIRSFSEILLGAETLSPDERRRFVSTIHQESLRLTKLLDEILDLNALERGGRAWENSPMDAERALDRAIEVCAPMAAQRGIRMEMGVRSPSALISGHADRLCQVFINLITNAIKYNDAAEPVVKITSIINRRNHVVVVEDNGPGIAAEDRVRIFEKFSRGSRKNGRDENGSGLGLAISLQIVQKMNGRLELVSGTGQGSRFRVTLPLADPIIGADRLLTQQEI